MDSRATILHLTDLHLGDDAPGAETGYYSGDLVERKAREHRRKLLDQTLRAVARDEETELAAVVISGDITYAGRENGFEELEGLLAKLGDRRPADKQIVVVPGNHDVASGTEPSSEERYSLFRRYVVDHGYVVPALGSEDSVQRHSLLVDEDHGFVIAPLNSANWCQQKEKLGPEIEALLESEDTDEQVRAEIERLRRADPARIEGDHLEGIRDRLDEVDADRALTRIAVLHHHLLPVTPREDMRPYEGITNLQILRNFLAVNNFRLVLHGHKHAELAYYDRIIDTEEEFADRSTPVLVVSGSTVGAEGPREDACRLVKLRNGNAPLAEIGRIDATDAGSRLSTPNITPYPLWNAPRPAAIRSPVPSVVCGESIEQVYERISQVVEQAGGAPLSASLLNLVCHVDSGNPGGPPDCYPTDFLEGRQAQDWFSQTVKWWQQPGKKRRHGEGPEFSHGDRIRNYRDDTDQIESVVRVLEGRDHFNGRAIASLFDPSIDRFGEQGPPDHRFPAFVTVQFVRRPGSYGKPDLIDVIGYFRKQELRYWWAVNAAELATLQAEVIDRLRGVAAGALTTISAIAYVDERPPRVVIPRIDLLFEEDERRLFELTYALGSSSSPEPRILEDWKRIIEDLVPPEISPEGGPSLALDGLTWVSELASNLAHASEDENVQAVARKLSDIVNSNETYAEKALEKPHDTKIYAKWQKAVVEQLEDLDAAVKGCLT